MNRGMILAAFQGRAFLTFPSVPAFKPSKLDDPASDVSELSIQDRKKATGLYR